MVCSFVFQGALLVPLLLAKEKEGENLQFPAAEPDLEALRHGSGSE
jgi:hypothetical protein